MYAEGITPSMQRALDETERRRQKQLAYNEQHNIIPQSIIKPIRAVIEATAVAEEKEGYGIETIKAINPDKRRKMIKELRREMNKASKELAFEKAAELRDMIIELEKQ